MGRLIKEFADGSYLEYDRGSFDEWCVFYTPSNGNRFAPKDKDYFIELTKFANKHGTEKIYSDFVEVYDWTDNSLNPRTLNDITDLSYNYGDDALAVNVILSVLYLAMISEEKKENTRLGKRIKRLGVHVLLLENRTVEYAANFMRGMSWRTIDAECRKRGF